MSSVRDIDSLPAGLEALAQQHGDTLREDPGQTIRPSMADDSAGDPAGDASDETRSDDREARGDDRDTRGDDREARGDDRDTRGEDGDTIGQLTAQTVASRRPSSPPIEAQLTRPGRPSGMAHVAHASGAATMVMDEGEPSFGPAPGKPGADPLAVIDQLAAGQAGLAVPRLDLRESLGEGGMGIVLRAWQVALMREVAVKTLRPEKRKPKHTLELLREAWLTGSLEHPNVVPVYELSVDEHRSPLIVLKRISGVTWTELMRSPDAIRERFGAEDPLAWNLGILLQVLNAVRYAHSRGIVHRDLKPDNVMIGEFGEVYVVDWGIAVSLNDDGAGRLPLARDATHMAGTPCYMAPEMLGGANPQITERTDVYLLGGVLFHILAGQPPHAGDTPLALLVAVAQSEPRIPEDQPAGLAAICRRAMARFPEDRFESADEMRRAIVDFVQHNGSEQLAERAEARFAEMQELVAAAEGDGADVRARLYNLFGACRFGFLEALSAWRDNDAARDGLVRATTAMVEYELAQAEPLAAASLVADVEHIVDIPSELRTLIADAQARVDRQRRRVAELERLGRELDIRVGARVRFYAVLVLVALWTAAPAIGGALAPISPTYPGNLRMAGWSAVVFATVALASWIARAAMVRSTINRRFAYGILAMAAAQVVLHLGAAIGGELPQTVQTVQIFLWMCVVALLAITIERRFTPAAVVFAAVFFAVSWMPSHRFAGMSVVNLALLVNAVAIWAPRRLGADPRADAGDPDADADPAAPDDAPPG